MAGAWASFVEGGRCFPLRMVMNFMPSEPQVKP